jgi:type II secretory pathway component HofQ
VKALVLILALATSGAAGSQPTDVSGAVRPRRSTVTLDVKDADVRDVLLSLKTQCGIKNMIIDREVGGTATFYFREVPCPTAFRIVLRTYGLAEAK